MNTGTEFNGDNGIVLSLFILFLVIGMILFAVTM